MLFQLTLLFDVLNMTTRLKLNLNCVPKGDKPRDNLKNWCPISLASVLYKLVSSVIVSGIKKVLPKLISYTQTGFLDGRFIGESTRLII